MERLVLEKCNLENDEDCMYDINTIILKALLTTDNKLDYINTIRILYTTYGLEDKGTDLSKQELFVYVDLFSNDITYNCNVTIDDSDFEDKLEYTISFVDLTTSEQEFITSLCDKHLNI